MNSIKMKLLKRKVENENLTSKLEKLLVKYAGNKEATQIIEREIYRRYER